ncbi:hypothetical protein pipiens_017324 [Culex pipiens pipiens]|uniref:Transcription elongation factor, mitochondrial n=1 Tax=Culex pipiens pipiens TaxID=38569 RepID=A0ABD1CHZ5_CULPP
MFARLPLVRIQNNWLGSIVGRNFNVKSSTNLGFPCTYTEEETQKILETINENDVEQLYKYNITKYRLKRIEGWRKKFGRFMSLDQVLELDGFRITVLRKFYDSIVQTPATSEELVQKVAKKDIKFTTPVFSANLIPKVQSCVSLYVGLDFVTWAKFKVVKDQPTVLAGWNSFQIVDRKLHVSELIRNVTQLNQLIPEADVYVVENPAVAQTVAMGSAVQTNINVQRSQLIAMIVLSLSESPGRRSGSCRQRRFLLQAGPSEEPDIEQTPVKLTIPSGLKVVYEENDNAEREFLGQAVLLGLSFLRLSVFKCENSLKVFRR